MYKDSVICVHLSNFKDRLFSKTTLFKSVQLIFSFSGMLVHAYKPFQRSIYDCTLIPAVLGGYSLISIIFLLCYLCCQQKFISLYMIVALLAIPLYIATISALMDTIPKDNSSSWTILLIETAFCILALASHFIEILHTYVTNESRPSGFIRSQTNSSSTYA